MYANDLDRTIANIPASVIRIGDRAFSGCINLKKVFLPPNLASIGEEAFLGCKSLESVRFPRTITRIGRLAFGGCHSLQTAIFEPDTRLPPSLGEALFEMCTRLEVVSLPPSLQTIPSWMFSDCRRLQFINLPMSVSRIGNHAFRNCTSLPSLHFPFHLTDIGNGAFNGCTFSTLLLPRALRNIGDPNTQSNPDPIIRDSTSVFGNNPHLELVLIRPPDGNSDEFLRIRFTAFRNCPLLETIFCPREGERGIIGGFAELYRYGSAIDAAIRAQAITEIKEISSLDPQDFQDLMIKASSIIERARRTPLSLRNLSERELTGNYYRNSRRW